VKSYLLGALMKCKYCAKFKSVTLASGNFPKGKYKEERICPFKDMIVNREDDIFKKIPVKDDKGKEVKGKFTKEYCLGFELVDTFYCEQGYVVSLGGCFKRQEDEEETACYRCKKKDELLEMKKIAFLMKKKRAQAKPKFKPIVR
jgi:hypothetical protein